jgi:hypothetical protein
MRSCLLSRGIVLRRLLISVLVLSGSLAAQGRFLATSVDSIPRDLPLPTVTTLNNPTDGYIFASVPYWGSGSSYLVVYNNLGKPTFFRKASSLSTDFKVHENGLLTYYDGIARKFFALDSSLAVVDSFWVKNGYTTDEHEIKFTRNGTVLLIGHTSRSYDMSQIVAGGDRNASVVVNVIQELDRNKNVVFEWKAFEKYKLTDVGPGVNLRDLAFVHTHLNSIDFDLDSNLIVSSRNLDEITKIDRKSGEIIWRMGGKNNQFTFINDAVGFSAQHSATILPNGHLLLFDNGNFHTPHFSRAVEYRLDQTAKTATLVWSYRNTPDVASIFWGNAQRLKNGNTFISWGKSEIGATEVNANGEKVLEMKFPADVFSYRILKFAFSPRNPVSKVDDAALPMQITLEKNYPNPFNGSTAISFQLSAITNVRLSIYDILGREIKVIMNEQKGPGWHRVFFTPQDLPSGILICRLQAGGASIAGTMIYVK